MTQGEAEALLGFPVGEGWTFHEVRRGGELAGFFMQRGAEVHTWRHPQFAGRWVFGGDMRRVAAQVLSQHGHVTTKVRPGNALGQRWVEGLGFERVGTDGQGNLMYRARTIKHARL